MGNLILVNSRSRQTGALYAGGRQKKSGLRFSPDLLTSIYKCLVFYAFAVGAVTGINFDDLAFVYEHGHHDFSAGFQGSRL